MAAHASVCVLVCTRMCVFSYLQSSGSHSRVWMLNNMVRLALDTSVQ